MLENLDAVEQYIMRRDDDEDEAVEDSLPQQKTAFLGTTT